MLRTACSERSCAPVVPLGWRRASLHLGLFLLSGVLSACTEGDVAPKAPVAQIVGGVGETLGRFRRPRAVAVDPASGRFYVVDRTGRVQQFEPDGTPRLEWYMPEYEHGQPVGIVVEEGGTVLINDSHYGRLVRFSADGDKILNQWGSTGLEPGQFTFGRDVTVDSAGNIYAGDYGNSNDRIQKFSRDGSFLQTWGRRGVGPGEFQRPQGMVIERYDGAEWLLVADCANHRIQRFTLEGVFVSMFGSVGFAAGEMRYPSSVVVASDATLLVSEWGNNRVQRFDREGHSLGFWGTAGRDVGELATPWDIAVGPDGRFFVVDYDNHRLQVFRWPLEIADRERGGVGRGGEL